MNSSDREHLENALKQFNVFLLHGLIAIDENKPLPPEFVRSTATIISNGMNELAQISPELKEKHHLVDWDHIEMMRDPAAVQKGIIEHPSWLTTDMKDEIPAAIGKIKEILGTI